MATGRALSLAGEVARAIQPDVQAMARSLAQNHSTIYAEALTFAFAERMPRPTAQAAVKALCQEAVETGRDLLTLAARDYPQTDWTAWPSGSALLGSAPIEAIQFARVVHRP